jgi:hypothetical protein
MVNISLIKKSNNQIDESSVPRVAVFVGGTAGIGKITLAAVAGVGISFKAYVIGRKESEQSFKPFIDELHQANPNANVIWVEGQVSLLSEVKRICDHIKTLESEVDLLFMTPGYAPFSGRESIIFLSKCRHRLISSRYVRRLGYQSFTEFLLPHLLHRESPPPPSSIRASTSHQCSLGRIRKRAFSQYQRFESRTTRRLRANGNPNAYGNDGHSHP